MSDSILTSTKAALGVLEDVEVFDPELIMHINSVFADYHELGIGPDEGYEITDKTATWADFLNNEMRYNSAKSLMFLRVRMLFDPPSVGYVLTAYEKLIEKAEWRLNRAREDIAYPLPPPPEALEVELLDETDPFGDNVVAGQLTFDPESGDVWKEEV